MDVNENVRKLLLQAIAASCLHQYCRSYIISERTRAEGGHVPLIFSETVSDKIFKIGCVSVVKLHEMGNLFEKSLNYMGTLFLKTNPLNMGMCFEQPAAYP